MYLPSMTDDEIAVYAYQFADTELERNLADRIFGYQAQINEARASNDDLEDKLSEATSEIESLQTEIGDLNETIVDLKADLRDAHNDRSAVLASLKELVALAELGDADLDEANWHPALETARAAIDNAET